MNADVPPMLPGYRPKKSLGNVNPAFDSKDSINAEVP